ncbi:MAG: hypothetical protein WAO83_10095 [Fuerstiella sp.]
MPGSLVAAESAGDRIRVANIRRITISGRSELPDGMVRNGVHEN